jgi:hypothetical protein
MAKLKKETESFPKNVNGKFYTSVKVSHLLYVAIEIEVHKGIVVGVKPLQKAGDLAASSVGHCSRGIWSVLKTQGIEQVLPEGKTDS